MTPREKALARFHASYEVDESGCWLWTRSLQTAGYAQIMVDGVRGLAHRFAYVAFIGEIPPGLVLDHSCHVRHCVNPDHLRPVTVKENCENLAPRRRNGSGVRGVSWDARAGRWIAQVKHHGVSRFVGRFDDIDEARRAVVAARNGLFTNNAADRLSA